MHLQNEALRSYLSHDDLPESVTILAGDELSALGAKMTAESGEPPGKNLTIVKFDQRSWGVVAIALLFFAFGAGLVCREFWFDEAYTDNQNMAGLLALLAAMLGIVFYAVLHAGFSYRWLIVAESRVRFRARRFILYRVESFPFASLEEIAVEIYPTSRRNTLARLVLTQGGRRIELFQGHVDAAHHGFIAWTAELLSLATGLPVTKRKF